MILSTRMMTRWRSRGLASRCISYECSCHERLTTHLLYTLRNS